MPSFPLDCINSWTTSGMSCYNLPWNAHMIKQRRAWHARMGLGRQTWSDDIGRGMPSSPLGRTHGRTTLGVTCHLRPWRAHTVGRRLAWQAIIALRQYTRSNYVRRGMPSLPLSRTHVQTMQVVEMQSSLLECTHSRTTSDMTCYLRHFIPHTIG